MLEAETENNPITPWRIELLGGLRATRGERTITRFRTQKAGLLLAYLAYHRDRTHPRSVLMELLWPEHRLEPARASLSMALSSLRRELETAPSASRSTQHTAHSAQHTATDGSELCAERRAPCAAAGPQVILTGQAAVQLNPAVITTDVAEFAAALQAAGRAGSGPDRAHWLANAVDLYRGELLPGFFDDWILQERRWLAEQYFQGLSQLLASLERDGEFERALQYARRGVTADSLREEAHRDLIRLYIAAGQPGAARRQYEELVRLLRQQLNAEPSAATRSLVRGLAHQSEVLEVKHRQAMSEPPSATGGDGALPPDSSLYVARPSDQLLQAALQRRDSIVLLKGAREMGKTRLLARGLQQAREAGVRVALTDFRMLDVADLESVERLYLTLGDWLAYQLELDVFPNVVWKAHLGPSTNFERYLRREVLERITTPMVWGMDEVDRLFPYEGSSQVFGLFRSWHNRRELEPAGPWSRLTLVIAYATEAHLFITDLNQSPFNVGTPITLADFTLDQVAELNGRCGSPLPDQAAIARYHHLLNGHPGLVRRGLEEMSTQGLDIEGLERQADRDDGIFGSHLRRMLVPLMKDADLCEAVRVVLRGSACPTAESFYRLRSAGVLAGESAHDARPRCPLYATYLERYLMGVL
jgi:DNA-binding SARP family transcriptional activator